MVLPSTESNHFFKGIQGASAREVRSLVKSWIRLYYSDVLGSTVHLIDQPNGLELIERKLKSIMMERGMIKETAVEFAA